MPPTDPRFTSMPIEDQIVEFEAILAHQGETIKECPCGMVTHSKVCPDCGTKLTGDTLADEVRRKVENGEDVDLNLLAGIQNDEFAPVEPGERP